MNPKGKQFENEQKSITIKLSAALKHQLNTTRKKTGETQGKIIERAIAELLLARQELKEDRARQKLTARQLRDIANDLRRVAQKIDKVAFEQQAHDCKSPDVILIGKKHPWHDHPQKEKLFQIVRDMHRVGANLTMIASALNLEGLQAFSEDGEWEVADIDRIVTEIKKGQGYLPPLYSLPE
ncbi:MAG: ribbon-helix-helix protein, CopG family [Desulfobacterales bacterium]|jgi:predicted transcriptional regulator